MRTMSSGPIERLEKGLEDFVGRVERRRQTRAYLNLLASAQRTRLGTSLRQRTRHRQRRIELVGLLIELSVTHGIRAQCSRNRSFEHAHVNLSGHPQRTKRIAPSSTRAQTSGGAKDLTLARSADMSAHASGRAGRRRECNIVTSVMQV